MRFVFIHTLSLLLFCPFYVQSQSYPEEFADFFIDDKQSVEIIVTGISETIYVESIVNFDRFKIERNNESEKKIRNFLQRNNVDKESQIRIVNDLIVGIARDENCYAIDMCDGVYKYFFDFDSQKLTINPINLKFNETYLPTYHDIEEKKLSLINSFSFYADVNESKNKITFDDNLIVSLPIGHLETNFFVGYDSYDDELIYQLEDTYYQANYQNAKLKIGQSLSSRPSFNETDFLDYGMRGSSRYAISGSSDDLLVGSSARSRRVYYYSPSVTRVEFIRDGKVLFNKVASQGANYISYDSLPKGIYNLNIVSNDGGKQRVLESVLVANMPDYNLGVNRFDTALGYSELYLGRDFSSKPLSVGTAKVAFRPFNNLIFGTSYIGNGKQNYVQLGSKMLVSDVVNLSAVGGYFDESNHYARISASASALYINYESLVSSLDSPSQLLEYLYGESTYRRLSAGVNGSLSGVRYYLQYSNYAQQPIDLRLGSYTSILSAPLFGGELSLNGSFTQQPNKDEWNISLNWSYKLGAGFGYSTGIATNHNSSSYVEQMLTHTSNTDNWGTSVSARARIQNDRDTDNRIDASAYVNQQAFAADGLISTSSDRDISSSVSLKSSQIVDSDGVYFSSIRSPSYVKALVESVEELTEREDLLVTIEKDNKYYAREYVNDFAIVPISPYSDIGVYIDQGLEYQQSVKKFIGFTSPGIVFDVVSSIDETTTKVVVLEDLYGNDVYVAQCIGSGCISIEPVTDDGVFRLNTKPKQDYQIISNKGLCIINNNATDNYSRGYCLPENINTVSALFESKETEIIKEGIDGIYYVGQFTEQPMVEHVISSLDASQIKYQVKEIGDRYFVYLINNDVINNAQVNALRNISSYVSNLNLDNQFTVNY